VVEHNVENYSIMGIISTEFFRKRLQGNQSTTILLLRENLAINNNQTNFHYITTQHGIL